MMQVIYYPPQDFLSGTYENDFFFQCFFNLQKIKYVEEQNN